MLSRVLLAALASSVLLEARAAAQEKAIETQSNFFRNRNTSVTERPQPEFDPLGIRLGSFLAYPQLSLTGEYNSNVFAEEDRPRDDLVIALEPELRVNSQWSRHGLSAYARLNRRWFLTYTDESVTDWQAGAQGHLSAGRTILRAGGEYGRLSEPRTAPNTSRVSREPIRYEEASAFAQATREVSRIRLHARAELRDLDFHSQRDELGEPGFEDNRDHRATLFSGRIDYALTPAAAFYVGGSYNWRDYRLAPPATSVDRDSDGYEVVGGFDFDLSALLRGQVQGGYFRQSYESPSLGTLSGFAALARVEWFPTQLTTVTFTGARRVEDGGREGTPVFISTSAGVRADHELLRNLILHLRAEYVDDSYRGTDRDDRRIEAGAGADYRMNRNVGLRLTYTYLDQNSRGQERRRGFEAHRVLLSVVLKR